MGNAPYDPNYGQYQQPPPDPYGQQNYQQPQGQVMFQQQPPPGYPGPYAPPPPPPPAVKCGAGGMIMAIIGGVMALLCVFMLFMMTGEGETEFIGLDEISWEESYGYAWLIPVFGILMLVFGIIAYAAQNKVMAILAGVFGILTLLLPLVLALDLASNFGSVVDVFFYSESYGGMYYSYSYTQIYLGGIMAMIGGLLGTIGGFSMMGKLR